jgi:hypothetical protein
MWMRNSFLLELCVLARELKRLALYVRPGNGTWMSPRPQQGSTHDEMPRPATFTHELARPAALSKATAMQAHSLAVNHCSDSMHHRQVMQETCQSQVACRNSQHYMYNKILFVL